MAMTKISEWMLSSCGSSAKVCLVELLAQGAGPEFWHVMVGLKSAVHTKMGILVPVLSMYCGPVCLQEWRMSTKFKPVQPLWNWDYTWNGKTYTARIHRAFGYNNYLKFQKRKKWLSRFKCAMQFEFHFNGSSILLVVPPHGCYRIRSGQVFGTR